MNISTKDERTAFSVWMRTGRWPRAEAGRNLEVKFNPWHDPENGRFTFVGGGRNYTGQSSRSNAGSASAANRRSQDVPKVAYVEDPTLPKLHNMAEVEVWRSNERAKHAHEPDYLEAIEVQYRRYQAEFAKGSLAELGNLAGNSAANDRSLTAGSSGADSNFSGGGATGSWGDPGFPGGGGSFGGGGTTGSWGDPRFAGGGGSFGGGGASSNWGDPGLAGGSGSFGGGGATGNWDDPRFAGGGGSFGGSGASGNWGDPGFAGGGGSFGGGGASGSWGDPGFAGGGGSFGGGGASGSWGAPRFTGGGGSFGGNGAGGSWRTPSPARRAESFGGQGATGSWAESTGQDGKFGGAGASGDWSKPAANAPNSTRAARANRQGQTRSKPSGRSEQFRRVERNGYEYRIDSMGRTREVSGTLTLSATQVRSKRAQSEAGGADRRHNDDGGHYIAARFNGPTDAFNHFAQNSNFNRGVYRKLEDGWAAAQRAGMRVTVNIVPHYQGRSQRPSSILVRFSIDGHPSKNRFWNEHKGMKNAEQ